MTNMKKIVLAGICVTSSTLALAAGQSSTNFKMQRDTINAGVANMSSTNFVMASSVGDAVAGGRITSVSFQLSSGFRGQIDASPGLLNLLSVVSRKIHGSTPFELNVDLAQPITGSITVEPRTIGTGHTLVFHFDNTVTSVGAATAIDALSAVTGSATVATSGNDAIVTLTGVPDSKRLTVKLTGINGSGTASASMGFMIGDVNSTRAVNSSDISGVKARSGQTTTAANFLFDVNVTGAVNSSDISAVKARSGTTLSP